MTNKAINRPRRPRQRWLNWTWHRAKNGEFFVRATFANGNIAWSSSETYTRRSRALENALLFGCPEGLYTREAGVPVGSLSLGEAP